MLCYVIHTYAVTCVLDHDVRRMICLA